MTEPTPRKSRMPWIIGGLIVVVLALAGTVAVLLMDRGTTSKPAAAAVPSIENIPQPNWLCTPAADRKITATDDVSKIQWFGWLDGKQADMPVVQALSLRIQGHQVTDAWYCPPRSDW